MSKIMKGLRFLAYLQVNRVTCHTSWMLAGHTGLLGQRQSTSLPTAIAVPIVTSALVLRTPIPTGRQEDGQMTLKHEVVV